MDSERLIPGNAPDIMWRERSYASTPEAWVAPQLDRVPTASTGALSGGTGLGGTGHRDRTGWNDPAA